MRRARADRDGQRRLLRRRGAPRAGRAARRGIPVSGRPVDPHDDLADAPGDRRPGAARWPDRLRPPARLARSRRRRRRCTSDQAWPAHLAEMDRSGRPRQLAARAGHDGRRRGAPRSVCSDGSTAPLPLAELAWARQVDAEGNPGPPIERADQVVAPGDVIWVEKVAAPAATAGEPARTRTTPCARSPEIEGAIVALNPHTGRVLAIQRRLQLRPQRVQPGDAGAAAAGLGVQALRLPGRAGGRLHPVEHPARRADRDRPGSRARQVEAGKLLEALLRAEHVASRPREVAQRDDRPPRPGDRHGSHQGNGRHGSASSAAWATTSPRRWARTRSPCSS